MLHQVAIEHRKILNFGSQRRLILDEIYFSFHYLNQIIIDLSYNTDCILIDDKKTKSKIMKVSKEALFTVKYMPLH